MRQSTDSDRLYRDPDLAQFYDLANGWGPDLEYCFRLAEDARSVLDLGCGTGALVSRLAPTHEAVGVDPAGAMLKIARGREGGDHATWVEADVRGLRLESRFDLITLTGHAFQVFLNEADQRAAITCIFEHLSPGGRFVFDTRNPKTEEWRTWTPDESRHTLTHPLLGEIVSWNDVERDEATGIVTYQTHYLVSATREHYQAASQLSFPPRNTVTAYLNDAGLMVDHWLGDWNGAECTEHSPEIIAIGHLR